MNLRDSKHYKGFTLVELLVVISIIALLLSILVPALSRARQLAMKTQCASQMRQIGLGISLYMSSESGGRFPQDFRYPSWITAANPTTMTLRWWVAIMPYVDKQFKFYFQSGYDPTKGNACGTVGHCPNHTPKDRMAAKLSPRLGNDNSYRGNVFLMTKSSGTNRQDDMRPVRSESVLLPAQKILVFECHTAADIPIVGQFCVENGIDYGAWLKYPHTRISGLGPAKQTHGNVSNFLFSDMHVGSQFGGNELGNHTEHWSLRSNSWSIDKASVPE